MLESKTDSIEKLLNKKPRLMDSYLQESKHLFGKNKYGNFESPCWTMRNSSPI